MNDVPDQNASIAVPLSFLAMMGRATDSEVASRAACALKSVLLELERGFEIREMLMRHAVPSVSEAGNSRRMYIPRV
jgi:hypothetical protein